MVGVGALMVVVAYLVHSRGLLDKRRAEGKPAKNQVAALQTVTQSANQPSKQSRKTIWRPNVAHMSRNQAQAPPANSSSSHDAAQNFRALRARRSSVA